MEDEDDVVVPHHEAVLVTSGFLVPVDKSRHQLNDNLKVKIKKLCSSIRAELSDVSSRYHSGTQRSWLEMNTTEARARAGRGRRDTSW